LPSPDRAPGDAPEPGTGAPEPGSNVDGTGGTPDPREGLSTFHKAFDQLYPAIRFTYERLGGQVWFSEIRPHLWLGGAPSYDRDLEDLLRLEIRAIVDMRAEREAHEDWFREHDIAFRRYRVPDVTVPDESVLDDAVAWIDERLAEDRRVLVHCAKGRGRSATVLAAYLMKTEGLTFDEVEELLTSRRSLVKLQERHRRVLESWSARQHDRTRSPDHPQEDRP
jgi:rhodanese-related sulfurtransferase